MRLSHVSLVVCSTAGLALLAAATAIEWAQFWDVTGSDNATTSVSCAGPACATVVAPAHGFPPGETNIVALFNRIPR